MAVSTQWQNRIVRTGLAPVDQIQFSGKNWRIHPKSQQDALVGVLSEVGWVQNVLINDRTGNLIDGHARVTVADRNGETEIPAVWVDLSEEEEALILATLDPLAAMAATDREQLDALLHEVSTGDAAVQAMLDQLAAQAGLVPPIDPMAEWQGMPEFAQDDKTAFHTILVHFDSLNDVTAFGALVQQAVSDSTKFIWFPKKSRESNEMAFDES
jgi:hypothetical protein